jgi:hypothetical protein
MKKLIFSVLVSMLQIQSCCSISIEKVLTRRNIVLTSIIGGVAGAWHYNADKKCQFGMEGYRDYGNGQWSKRRIKLSDHEVINLRAQMRQYQFLEKFCYTFCGLYALKFGIKGFNKSRSLIQRFRSKPTLPKTI